MTAPFFEYGLFGNAASLAIASGADMKVVQKMLGHASATMTLDTYGHLFEDRLDEVAAALATSTVRALADALEAERAALVAELGGLCLTHSGEGPYRVVLDGLCTQDVQ